MTHEPFRGIFPVLLTPLDDDGKFIESEFERQIEFCVEAGAHGVVFPVLASEFPYLTDDERRRGMEIAVKTVAGRIPVVGGVAAPSRQVAVGYARAAADAGVDAVIALPPDINGGTPEQNRRYYEEVSAAAGRTMFIQHTTAGMSPEFMQSLMREVEHVRYLKEEMMPSAHQISAVLDGIGDDCDGVFGGGYNRWMMSELHRGAHGFMPATDAVDVHVQIWEAWQRGDEAGARRIFNQMLPLINLTVLLGIPVGKHVLMHRGIFSTPHMRRPGDAGLDADDQRELDIILEELRPLFRV